jgi:hypothetical protein
MALGSELDKKGMPKKSTRCPNTESIRAATMTLSDLLLRDVFLTYQSSDA